MSGYKRVNFYELCRLCATNQQKDKTHIFQEEGRKIQLQNKIQSCLSLKVCENDFLPKVVCSQCLRTLEECSAFRKECYTSETMLSSYFNNFRYTEDFKKSGKVYIKDTPKAITTAEVPLIQTPTTGTVATAGNTYNVNVIPNVTQQENLPYYTLHLPSVTSQTNEGKAIKDSKIIAQPQIVYNLNTIKTVVPNLAKNNMNEAISNVTVNSNGEIITIAPLVDVDTFLAQNVIQKPQKKNHRKYRIDNGKSVDDSNIIKIDLTQPEVDSKRDALEKMKMQQQNKISYTIKIDDPSKGPFVMNSLDGVNRTTTSCNTNQSVILNPASRPTTVTNNLPNRNQKTYPTYNNNINLNVSMPNMNIPTSNINITTSNINIPISGMNPTDITNLNPEPPPSSIVSLPVSTFNSIQNLHYSINANSKQDVHVDNVSIASDALATMFGTSGTTPSVTTNHNPMPVVRNSTNSVLNSISTQNLNFSNVNASNFSTSATNLNAIAGSNTTSTDPLIKPDKRHSCDICCKTFKRREHLYQHVKLHTGFRPFKCENCNKSFMRKEHLLRHMTSHSGQKNYTCGVCEKSFSRNDNLLKHKKIHNKQNSFTCEICQKQFVMEHYYLAHKLTHDSEKCNQVNPVWGLLKAV